MTHSKPDDWRGWFVYAVRLALIALVGYGFSNFRQQIIQDRDIADLKEEVRVLRGEVKQLNDQHIHIMTVQLPSIQNDITALKALHDAEEDARRGRAKRAPRDGQLKRTPTAQ